MTKNEIGKIKLNLLKKTNSPPFVYGCDYAESSVSLDSYPYFDLM